MKLLWVDSLGGLLVGAGVCLLRGWLARLYALPEGLVLFLGVSNLAYGCFSLSLAAVPRWRTVPRIGTLALANMTWTAVCVVLSVVSFGQVSLFGLAHLLGEGVYVGVLGLLEWRARHVLAMR